jgi:hypothetical protein
MRAYDESLRDESAAGDISSLSSLDAPANDFHSESVAQTAAPLLAESADNTPRDVEIEDAELRDAETQDLEPDTLPSLDSTDPFSHSDSLEASPETPDTPYQDSHEPSFRPSGLPTHPESLLSPSDVTERILADLRANSHSPIDVALADLLSSQSTPNHVSQGYAEPATNDIHPHDANESETLDPESADKEHHE